METVRRVWESQSKRTCASTPPQEFCKEMFSQRALCDVRGNGHRAGQARGTIWGKATTSSSLFPAASEQHRRAADIFLWLLSQPFPMKPGQSLAERQWTENALMLWGPGSQRAGVAYGHWQRTAGRTDAKSQSQLRRGFLTRRNPQLPTL